MLYLPQTLAAVDSPALQSTIQAELLAKDLPLEHFLERGGWPEAPRVKVRGVRAEGEQVVVLLTVEFIEQCPAACPASARPETRVAYMLARIRKSDGFAEVLPD